MVMLASKEQFAALVSLFHGGTKLTYHKGEFIVRPGETPNSIYLIEKGLVKAFNISKYGEENLLIIRKENEVFPLIWALTGQEKEIIYQALTPTTVWRIDYETYIDAITHQLNALLPVLDIVTEMYRIHSERILNLEYRTVRERLISFLLTMSARFGKDTPEGVLIDVPLKHQDVASSINASRETANRELSVLERKGLIARRRSVVILKDSEGLRAYL